MFWKFFSKYFHSMHRSHKWAGSFCIALYLSEPHREKYPKEKLYKWLIIASLSNINMKYFNKFCSTFSPHKSDRIVVLSREKRYLEIYERWILLYIHLWKLLSTLPLFLEFSNKCLISRFSQDSETFHPLFSWFNLKEPSIFSLRPFVNTCIA